MKLIFDGQSQIDANTLINVLTHYQTVVIETNKELGGGVKEINIKVNAIEKGSFIIDLSVVENIRDFVTNVFSRENVEYAGNLVAYVIGVYELYKIFKGKKITAKDKPKIDAAIKGDVVINVNTTNIYNNRVTREAISKSFETAEDDTSVAGFSICDDKGESVSFQREEFKDYIYNDFDEEDAIPDEKHITVDASLVIVGLNFEPNGRWKFIYNGFPITMPVKDNLLMKLIDNGERFGKGDKIRVKMKIIQKYNSNYGTYENKSYKIVEFMEHMIAPREKGFLFPQE